MTEETNTGAAPKLERRQSARAKEERSERRRRTSDNPLDAIQLHLSSPREHDDPDYIYYWGNDDKGRIEYLTTHDDWDFCEDRNASDDHRNKDLGTKIRRAVGKARDGSPLFAYRLKKRRDWHEDDMAEYHRRLDEKQNLLRRTQDDGSGKGILSGDPQHGYIPPEIDTAMPRIRRGRS
jgi:hypothetical protein